MVFDRKAWRKKYHIEHLEHEKLKGKEWKAKNPERVKSIKKQFREGHPDLDRPRNKRRIILKGKRIHLKENLRTGNCSKCPNNIHDNSCKKTAMHHWFYIIIMPWACTIELCVGCHNKERRKTSYKSDNAQNKN